MKAAARIRRAMETDLSRVLELERGTASAPHWSETEYAAMLECGAAHGVRRSLFVAESDVGLCGFAVGKVVGDDAELESVVVDAVSRRKGAGRALVRAVMEWSREEGARAIDLEVRAASGGAQTLYAGLRFAVVGTRPRYYHDSADDAVLMRCELKGGMRKGKSDRE